VRRGGGVGSIVGCGGVSGTTVGGEGRLLVFVFVFCVLAWRVCRGWMVTYQ